MQAKTHDAFACSRSRIDGIQLGSLNLIVAGKDIGTLYPAHYHHLANHIASIDQSSDRDSNALSSAQNVAADSHLAQVAAD